LRPSSVDRKFGAVRVGRVEPKEQDGLRDFLRRPEAFHRDNTGHLLLDLGNRVFIGKHFAEDRRVDGTGRHRVDANFPRKQLDGERPGQGSQRSLGGSIGGLAGQSLNVGDGGREDDRAAPVDQRRELLNREKRSLGVQVEHLVVDGRGHVLEALEC